MNALSLKRSRLPAPQHLLLLVVVPGVVCLQLRCVHTRPSLLLWLPTSRWGRPAVLPLLWGLPPGGGRGQKQCSPQDLNG